MIRLIRPYISFGEVEADFREVFDSGIFTKGVNVARFREALCAYTGAGFAHLTTSATTALWTCLKIAGIKPGDEVVVSDFSFPASANVIEDLSAIPVFADVDPFTFNMLPEELEQKITDRTRAVMFVDAFGNPTGIGRIREICRAAGLTLIEDAACAIGSSFHGIRCGAISDLTCFSFHPRKLLTTGEGGAILTGDEAFSSTLDVILNHGAVPRGMEYNFVECGYNFRLPELQAIMGIKQLKKLDSIVKSRTQIRNVCAGRLADLGFTAQSVGEGVVHNVQSLVFVVPEGVDRDRLVVSLKERGIESTIGTYCLSGTTYYRSRYRNVLPNSQMLFEKTITLPCYEGVDTDFICDEIAGIVKHGAGRDHQKSVNP